MPERIGPGGAAEFVVDLLVREYGIDLGLGDFDILRQNIVECLCRAVANPFFLAVHQSDDLREGSHLPLSVLGEHRAFFLRQEPGGHLRPVRRGGGGLEVQDLLLGLAQVIARLGKDPLQKMAVFGKTLVIEESFLQFGFDPGDAEVKELALVFELFAELFDLVEPGLQFRIVLVLLGPEPEIIPFIAVGAILSLPRFILVQRPAQDRRVFEIIGAVLPGVDERSSSSVSTSLPSCPRSADRCLPRKAASGSRLPLADHYRFFLNTGHSHSSGPLPGHRMPACAPVIRLPCTFIFP